jgi:hypothetical protein
VLDAGCDDASDLLDLAVEEDDEETAQSVEQDLAGLESELEKLEFRRMFSGETDPNNAYLDIQAGSGGTEAQDWAEMLLRMYLRWGEDKGFKTTLVEASAGEVAGLKSATIQFEGGVRLSVGCAPRPACTDWCASHPLTAAGGGIPPLPPFLCRRKLTTISTSKLIRQICGSIPIALRVLAGST